MNDSLQQVLGDKPEIGIVSSSGAGLLYWLDIVNPILSCVSLIVGLSVGIVTLIIKIKQWRK